MRMALLKRTDLPGWLSRKYGTAIVLAKALGVTRQTAHNFLSGRTLPSYENCHKLGLDIAFLLREEEGTRGMMDLSEFLTQRERDRQSGRGISELELNNLLLGEKGESMMKDVVQATRSTALRLGTVDGTSFQWDDGRSGRAMVPQLKLSPVGVEFNGLMFAGPGRSRQPRIVFGWVPTDSRAETRELPNQVWRLTLSSAAGALGWNVNGEEIMGVTSLELAQQIIKQLIEFRDEYILATQPTLRA